MGIIELVSLGPTGCGQPKDAFRPAESNPRLRFHEEKLEATRANVDIRSM
jgi:hypothetical protein